MSSHVKCHLDRFSRIAGFTNVTDRQTDHVIKGETIGRIYAMPTMRPKKVTQLCCNTGGATIEALRLVPPQIRINRKDGDKMRRCGVTSISVEMCKYVYT